MIRLSRRLQRIAEMASEGLPVTDVGTDHAYIPIALVEAGKAPFALASDINEGPLERARQNIEGLGLSDRIRTELCDGIPLDAPSGVLILAGMGGLLMSRILKRAEKLLPLFSIIVAEPQSDLDVLRQTLYELGFDISEEDMIREDGKYYACIKAISAAPDKRQALPERAGLLYGPLLIRDKNPVLREYLEKRERVNTGILTQMKKAGKEENSPEYQAIFRELALVKEVLGDMTSNEA